MQCPSTGRMPGRCPYLQRNPVGGISLSQCKKAEMNGNTFRDLGDKEYGVPGYIYSFSTCSDLTFDGAAIPGNDYLEYTP